MVAILCMNINVPIVHAENITLYISVSSSEVNVGDSITVTVSYSYSSSFAADFQLSWSGPVSFSGGSIGSSGVISAFGNGSASATFTATGPGTASFSVSGAGQDVVTEADLGVTPQGASVTIVDASSAPSTEAPSTEAPSSNNNTTQATTEDNDDGRSDNAFLSKLTITPGTLDPEFSPYTTSYKAQVDEDVTKLTVNATADDRNADVRVWGANELSPGENLVQVAVTAENGDVRYYDIHVMVGEDVGDPYTEIDGVKYAFINYEDGLEPPEGFEVSTLKYEKWQVMSYKSPNEKIDIVPLIPEEVDEEDEEDVEYEWYMYVEGKNCFVKYQEYNSRYNRYVILDAPEGVVLPEGYIETELTINGNKVLAYQPDKEFFKDYDSNMKVYLVYAVNIEGDAGFYLYDMHEDTFSRYMPLTVVEEVIVEATPTEATPEDATPDNAIPASDLNNDGFFTKEVITYILIGVSALLLIFIIVVICLGCKNRRLKDELEDAESMVHQLAGTEPAEKKSKKTKDSVTDIDLFSNEPLDLSAATEEASKEYTPEMTAINQAIDAAMDTTTEVVEEQKNMTLEELPLVDNTEGPKLEIPQIEDVDYEKKSEEINNKIKADYDAFLDSAFSDDTPAEVSSDVVEASVDATAETNTEITNSAAEATVEVPNESKDDN